MSLINFPILYIPDPTKGRPLFSGQIYVGKPDLDPTVAINQKQLNVIEEDGTVVPVSQPFTLSAGGVPVYDGNPVRLDVDGNYSIKILNKLGAQVYYIENVFEGQPVTELDLINDLSQAYEFATVAEYKAFATAFPVGKVIKTIEFASGTGGGASYTVIAGTGTANTYNIIANATTAQSIKLTESGTLNDRQFGVIADAVFTSYPTVTGTDNTLAMQFLLDYANTNEKTIYSDTGNRIVGNLTIPILTEWRGDSRHKTNFACLSGTTGKWIDSPSAQKVQLFDMAFYGAEEVGLTHVFNAGDVVPLGTEANCARLWFRDAPNAILCRILGNVCMIDSITVQSGRIGCELSNAYNFWSNFVIVDTSETALIGTSGTYSNFEFEGMETGSKFVELFNDAYMDGVIFSPTTGYTHANLVEIDAGAVDNWSVQNMTLVPGATITKQFKQGTKEWNGVNGNNNGQTSTNALTVGQEAASTPISDILRSVVVADFPSIAAGASATVSQALIGAITNAPTNIGYPNTGPFAGLRYEAYVDAADSITLKAYNTTAGAIDPPSQTFAVMVFNYT